MNLVKCSNCSKILIVELFESHKCDIPLKKTITIPISSFYDCTTKEKTIVGIGLDGNRYWLVVKKREALPWNPPNESLQGDAPNKDFTVPKLIIFK